jgi:hypothetical protein
MNITRKRTAFAGLALALLTITIWAAGGLLTLQNTSGAFDFGQQDVGTASAVQTTNFSNSGSGPLTISSVGMSGVNSGDFTISSDACTGATLGPDQSCAVGVQFGPTAAGDRSARLTLADDASGSPHTVPLSGAGVNPAAPRRTVGPIDLRHGFPLWYADEKGLRLQLCLDANGLCLSPVPDPTRPPSVTDTSINFPDETFWWSAESDIASASGARIQLVLALEAAFTTDGPTVGQQISFGRVRVRLEKVRAGQTYRITHPYGVDTVVADKDGRARFTEDLGALATPADFSQTLRSRVGPFLRWDPAVLPAPPAGYIGDPNVPHRVVGSPFGTNFFRVDGPDIGGPGINVVQTNLFTVQGKLF